ncbi:MAG: hypothetical protein QG655_3050 [Actinomycetota bacterium]|nr:hypothetical protein [Actinomycetota bacterium]
MRGNGAAASITACAAAVTLSVTAPTAWAERSDPVPIYGYYSVFIDHGRQTFNGRPAASPPDTQYGQFSTNCDVNGCVAHWYRLTELAQNPNAPAMYDYTWNNDRWESTSDYPFHCDRGGTAPSVRSDFLAPRPDGTFYAERTFVVGAPGCAGEGPGTYWLPLTLTPVEAPPPGSG